MKCLMRVRVLLCVHVRLGEDVWDVGVGNWLNYGIMSKITVNFLAQQREQASKKKTNSVKYFVH